MSINSLFASESFTQETWDTIIRPNIKTIDKFIDDRSRGSILRFTNISPSAYRVLIDNNFFNVQSPYYNVLSHVMIYFRAPVEERLMFMKYLIEKGADVNEQNDYGDSPLMICIDYYRSNENVHFRSEVLLPIITFLLEQGGEPLLYNKKGETAISMIFSSKIPYNQEKKEIIRMLREKC